MAQKPNYSPPPGKLAHDSVIASTNSNSARSTAFESFGVRLRVTADTPEVIERIPAMLPPDARPCSPSTVDESFGVLADDGGSYRFERGDSLVSGGLELEVALRLLENQLRTYIGLHAPSRIFVRAGVVASEGRAIVIPGLSMAGKTTLVLELVRGGADYYSDEFAVLDERGLVHPYPTTPSVREPAQPNHVDVQRLNRGQGDGPLTIGAVVLTAYRPARSGGPHGSRRAALRWPWSRTPRRQSAAGRRRCASSRGRSRRQSCWRGNEERRGSSCHSC